MHFKLIPAALIAGTTLIGCVDGDVSSALETRSPTRLPEPTVLSVGEGTQGSLSLSDDILEMAPVSESLDLTVTFQGKTIRVTARELDHPVMAEFDVYHRDGDESLIRRVQVLGINTSAQRSEGIGYEVTERSEELLSLAEDRSVHDYFVDLAYLNRTIEPDVRDRLVSYFNARQSGHYSTLKDQMEELQDVFDGYLMGEYGERTLRERAQQVESTMKQHGEHGRQRLDAIETLYDDFINRLPTTELVYDPASGRFSRFYHPDLVTTDGASGERIFRAGYTMLTPLIFR